MEESYFYISVIVLTVILFLRDLTRTRSTDDDVPSPPILDYIWPSGLMHSLYFRSGAFNSSVMSLTARHGPVFRMRLGLQRCTVSSNPADFAAVIGGNRDVFRKPSSVCYAMNSAAPGNIFTLEGDSHTALRRALRPGFHAGMLQKFHPSMADAVRELVDLLRTVCRQGPHALGDTLCPTGILDAGRVLSVVTLRTISNVAFGSELSLEERLRFADAIEDLSMEMVLDVITYPVRRVLERFGIRNRFFRAKRNIDSVARSMISRRLQQRQRGQVACDDLLDSILDVAKGDLDAAVTHTVTFALAGSLSTNHSLAWMLLEICTHPTSAAALRDEVDEVVARRRIGNDDVLPYDAIPELRVARAVWKEGLRLHPPGSGFMRVATEDVVLPGCGKTVRAGELAYVVTQAAQVDEQLFPEGKDFLPERWLAGSGAMEHGGGPREAYVPFGVGGHNCAGQFLSEYEGVLVLAELYRRFDIDLGCKREEVIAQSGFVEVGMYASGKDGRLNMGIPIVIRERETTADYET